MEVLQFPKLTKSVRRSMERRLRDGAPPGIIAVQYGVSIRWLRMQYSHLTTDRRTG
jgi:hypothetical protein